MFQGLEPGRQIEVRLGKAKGKEDSFERQKSLSRIGTKLDTVFRQAERTKHSKLTKSEGILMPGWASFFEALSVS